VKSIRLGFVVSAAESGYVRGRRTYFFLPGAIPELFSLPSGLRSAKLAATGLLGGGQVSSRDNLLQYINLQSRQTRQTPVEGLCVRLVRRSVDGVHFQIEKSFTRSAAARRKVA
jgi:hypothetical protein